MTRLFWVSLGATAGILVARRVRRAALAYAPANLAGNLGAGLRAFVDEVRTGMAEREAELRAGLGLDGGPDGGPEGER